MRYALIIITALFLTAPSSQALENLLFKAGVFHTAPSGDISLEPNYALKFGVGAQLVEDLYLVLEIDAPVKFDASEYPLIININGADIAFHFRKFTAMHGMLAGHYTLRIFEESKFLPKIYGGLGLYWLYNSQQSIVYPDIVFRGLGPEFGFGGLFEFTPNIWLDFTFSVKFAYYNEYAVEGNPTTSIGLDEQFLCFNLAFYYLLKLK